MKTAKLVDVYRCSSCNGPWLGLWDARRCCGPVRDTAWACDNVRCSDDGLHETESAANDCGTPHECACGHIEKSHAIQGQWRGCYDLDCRCAAYAPVTVAL